MTEEMPIILNFSFNKYLIIKSFIPLINKYN